MAYVTLLNITLEYYNQFTSFVCLLLTDAGKSEKDCKH